VEKNAKVKSRYLDQKTDVNCEKAFTKHTLNVYSWRRAGKAAERTGGREDSAQKGKRLRRRKRKPLQLPYYVQERGVTP